MATAHLAVTRVIRDFSDNPAGLADVIEGLIDHLDYQDADPDLEPDADHEPDLSTGAERWNVHMHTQPDLEIDEVEPVSA